MSKLLDKMMNLVGWEEDDDDEELWEEEDTFEEEPIKQNILNNNSFLKNRHNTKVVNIHSSAQIKVVILQPEDFDQAREISDHLKNKKPVIVNVEGLEKVLAQRIVDFLSGSVYVLNGNIQRVSHGIFLVAPDNVDILTKKEDLSDKGALYWAK